MTTLSTWCDRCGCYRAAVPASHCAITPSGVVFPCQGHDGWTPLHNNKQRLQLFVGGAHIEGEDPLTEAEVDAWSDALAATDDLATLAAGEMA